MLMDKLCGAISNIESDAAFSILLEMTKILHTITHSFIEGNGIGKLLTSIRKTFYNNNNLQSEAKTISISMRKIYGEKMARCLNRFNQIWGNKREQKLIGANEATYTCMLQVGDKFVFSEPVKSQIEFVIGDMEWGNHSNTETQTSAVYQPVIDVVLGNKFVSPRPVQPHIKSVTGDME
jgi:hypothetical protein